MLVDKSEYLSAGMHIGMKACTAYMAQFVYKIREDGLSVLNLEEVDSRIARAITLLSKYHKVLVVGHKETATEPAKKFAEVVEGKAMCSRFSPGTLTNPSYREFYEPDIVLVVDPSVDSQAIEEAKKRRVPIIGLCSTSNSPVDIDFIIPINNNSRKALALFFWILSRGLLKAKGKIKSDGDFKYTLVDFGDIGKPKKFSGGGELHLGGDADIDIDIQIESEEKKEKKKAVPKTKKPKEAKAKGDQTKAQLAEAKEEAEESEKREGDGKEKQTGVPPEQASKEVA